MIVAGLTWTRDPRMIHLKDEEAIADFGHISEPPLGWDPQRGLCTQRTNYREHPKLAQILTLGVADAFRKRGIARYMVDRMLHELARDASPPAAVYLHVIEYNHPAISLYEGLGFKRIASYPDYYTVDGAPYNGYLYAYYFLPRRNLGPWGKLWSWLRLPHNSPRQVS